MTTGRINQIAIVVRDWAGRRRARDANLADFATFSSNKNDIPSGSWPPTALECERAAFARLILADPRHCRVGASTRQFVEGYMDEPYVPSRYKLQASDTRGLHPYRGRSTGHR